MFRGRYEHSIDAKGRSSLPSRFRDVLSARDEERLVLTQHISDPCLVAYSVSEWQAFEAKVRALPRFDRNVVRLKRLFFSSAVECPLDRQGRILIPQSLRDAASLDREVIWVGMGESIELWSPGLWQAEFDAARKDPEAVARALADLGL
jgi:MraZ protein